MFSTNFYKTVVGDLIILQEEENCRPCSIVDTLQGVTTKLLELRQKMKPLFHAWPRGCEEGSGPMIDQKQPGPAGQNSGGRQKNTAAWPCQTTVSLGVLQESFST